MRQLKPLLLIVLASLALTISCVDPLEPTPVGQNSFGVDALVLSPKVFGISPTSKVETIDGDSSRGENTVDRIDVFVFKTKEGETTLATPSFHAHYLIKENNPLVVTGQKEYLLQANWSSATSDGPQYKSEDTYRIYAVANLDADYLYQGINTSDNPKIEIPVSITESNLQKLVAESRATIKGQYDNICYDIVRLQDDRITENPADGSNDHHIKTKRFLMDGVLDNWKIKQGKAKQYFSPEQCVSDTPSDVTTFSLSRAAAKFRVELDFTDFFKRSLGENADQDNLKFTTVNRWLDESNHIPEVETIVTIGSLAKDNLGNCYADSKVEGGARAKFANFMKATYVVDPGSPVSGLSSEDTEPLRDLNLWDSQSYFNFWTRHNDGTEDVPKIVSRYPYIDTTYSYAFDWAAGKAAEKAPALAVSVQYNTYEQRYKWNEDHTDVVFDGPAKQIKSETNYYRIPLVNEGNAVQRNYYYQVNAKINTKGSSTTDIEPTSVDLQYKVIPWPNNLEKTTNAQTSQLQYFVAETEYRLRGDGTQSINLQYFTPKSNKVGQHFEAEPKIVATSTEPLIVYYYNQSGAITELNKVTTYSNYSWSSSNGAEPDVHIEVLPNETGDGGYIKVSSKALSNRSVKYIEFEAVVDFTYDGGQPITRKFRITHFPLDNLQSILGAWSSRWDGQAPASGGTERYYRKVFYKRINKAVPVGQTEWAAGVGNDNAKRREANSPETAVNGYYATDASKTIEDYQYPVDLGLFGTAYANIISIQSYSWNGSTVTFSGTRERLVIGGTTSFNDARFLGYDYVDSYVVNNGHLLIDFWTYSNYYRLDVQEDSSYSPDGDDHSWGNYDRWEWEPCEESIYNSITQEDLKKKEFIPNAPGTLGNWVDWESHSGSVVNDGNFPAKIWGPYYGKPLERTYSIDGATSAQYWTNYDSEKDALKNNHMYVLQISKVGKDQYNHDVIVGRPNLDTNYLSDDNTVSPAFMIASQLGAVRPFGTDQDAARNAAAHCHSYMEVAKNGRRFTGWRLPTQAEINYIIQYQTSLASTDVFDVVLTGRYYYTLNKGTDGNRWATANTSDSQNSHAVRCIRDLTPAEVIELNNTGTILTAPY